MAIESTERIMYWIFLDYFNNSSGNALPCKNVLLELVRKEIELMAHEGNRHPT